MADGICSVCILKNIAKNGEMPVEKIEPAVTQYFEERSIGLNRAYLAKGANEQVDMVVRIQDEGFRPRIKMYAVLKDYDGQENDEGDQYRINLVQPVLNDDGLKCFDLTLQRLENFYDVISV